MKNARSSSGVREKSSRPDMGAENVKHILPVKQDPANQNQENQNQVKQNQVKQSQENLNHTKRVHKSDLSEIIHIRSMLDSNLVVLYQLQSQKTFRGCGGAHN